MRKRLLLVLTATLVGGGPAASAAMAADVPPLDRWLPNDPSASWVYGWSNDRHANVTTLERYVVAARSAGSLQLAWTTEGLDNPPGAATSQGSIDYRYTSSGLVNENWSSTPPPPQFPVLCPNPTGCGNSLAGAHYVLIWGSRTPVIQEPLVKGAEWESLGGQGSDVASINRYVGRERVVVPAFPAGVLAAKVESEITQVGSADDQFGSGVRTTWWVYGVGPVKSVLRHASGAQSTVQLHATSLAARALPSEVSAMPLRPGSVMRFRFTNSKHLRRPSVQQVVVGAVARNSARLDVREISGPITVRGSYVMTSGLDGVRSLSVRTRAALRGGFPQTGPRTQPVRSRRKLHTPIDLMIHGFNPVLPAYAEKGDTWKASRTGAARRIYGVTGTSKALGTATVKTPAGTYRAFGVRTTMTQRGFPFGSGRRTMWFAPGVGLVKLEFRHGDGSVSRVVRVPR